MADTWGVDTTDTVSAISGMADVLDQAADAVAVSTGISSPNVTSTPIGEGDAVNLNVGPSEIEGTINQGGGSVSPSVDLTMGGGPSEDTMPQSIYGTPGGTAPDITDLGERPSLQALQSAIDSVGVDSSMGGGPSDLINLMGEEEVVEEVAPGEEVATFLSDFNRSMSAESPEQGIVAKIDALQDQAAQLQAQAAGGHPDWGMSGPAVPISAEQAAATASGGGQGWNNPNTVQGQLDILSGKMDRLENLSMGLQSVQRGYPQPSLDIADYRGSAAQAAATASGGGQGWVNPNASFEELEGQFSTSPQVSPQVGMWQNPNTVRPPLEGANFPPNWYNVNEQRAYPTAMGGNLPISAEQAAATATGGGAGWVNPNTVVPDWYNVNEQIAYPTAMGGNLPISAEQAAATASGGAQGWINPNITEQEAVTTLAPKYTGQQYQTHNQMYPNHRNFAAMAGVASIKSMFDGTHKAWIASINQDMKDRKIELTHEINGQKTGKHSSADWKEYAALFDPETGLDKNGVPMPGTDKQAQAGIGGVLQGLWGGVLSGAQNLFKPKTSSGAEGRPYANLGYPPHASGNIPANIRQAAGDDTRGDNPIDIIRSTYTWAASLPNSVLFNAARYPDYLRLLIEYDAAGKDLPLTVPTWILEGTARPAEDGTETGNWITNHPAMQTQELTWT
jgi:hypothetical protein